MALGKTKQRLELLEAQVGAFRTAHQRADQRLDRVGPALAAELGDEASEHQAGRRKGVTDVGGVYTITVNNDPFSPTVRFNALQYDVPGQTWDLLSDANGDFDQFMLEQMEKWTVGAKTGVPVDDNRHVARAMALNQA